MRELHAKHFGLPGARALATAIMRDHRKLRPLIAALFGDDIEVRKRAADTCRRITEKQPALLHAYTDELMGLLAEMPLNESRTRWHLGMVVPRIASTQLQRLRAAQLMHLISEDESNVVRCSAIEGMTELALHDAKLRDDAEMLIENALFNGTKAMKSRARHAQKILAKAEKKLGRPRL